MKILFVATAVICMGSVTTLEAAQTTQEKFLAHTMAKEAYTPTLLTKAAHHRGASSGLELGQIALCFNNKPIYEELPKKDQGHQHIRGFYFPHVTVSEKIMTDFNKSQSDDLYKVALKQGKNGIQLLISYDSTKVSMNLNSCPRPFISIDYQKGLCLSFYNKPMLKKLNDHNDQMLRTASLNRRPLVVIDPGHGGIDSGAKSYCNDLEKDIALDVGLKVASLLKNASCDVLLTRDCDTTVALDERTTFANVRNADLFVSIHANHANKDTVCGIETFSLDDSFCNYSGRGADKEYEKTVQSFRNDLTKKSSRLAHYVHDTTLSNVKKKYTTVVSRNTKNAVSQVLMGTTMPATLIEVGFLSNKQEATLLKSSTYQYLLAHGITNGVLAYLNAVKVA